MEYTHTLEITNQLLVTPKTKVGSVYSIGNNWTSILYPKKDSLYIYVETDL